MHRNECCLLQNIRREMMDKTIDVTALGEVLIDFTFAGNGGDGKKLYEENPGGAPGNCACAVAKLGGNSAFIGMVGEDSFGEDIKKALSECGVDVCGIKKTPKQHTTLAFVSLDEKGERTFSFCRNPGADLMLSQKDVDMSLIKKSRIFHVGSLSLTAEPSRTAQLYSLARAKEEGCVISYDPNYRKSLWNGREDAVDVMKSILPSADIVKVSEDELFLLYGSDCSIESGAEKIIAEGVRLVLITLGSSGVFYIARLSDGNLVSGKVGVFSVKVVDTTGAGDSFTGGLLYRLTRRKEIFSFTKQELEKDLEFANAVASICVMHRGAIPALPSLKETEQFLNEAG